MSSWQPANFSRPAKCSYVGAEPRVFKFTYENAGRRWRGGRRDRKQQYEDQSINVNGLLSGCIEFILVLFAGMLIDMDSKKLNEKYSPTDLICACCFVTCIAQWSCMSDEIFTNWKNSQGHNQNMLRAEFTQYGLGVRFDESGQLWSTMVLISFGENKTGTRLNPR